MSRISSSAQPLDLACLQAICTIYGVSEFIIIDSENIIPPTAEKATITKNIKV
jgi:hypothetical protein